MSTLTFDDSLHEYRLDGRILPSVTTVLKELEFINSDFFTEESRNRGTLVHALCELDDLGTLDTESVDERLAGYLTAWREFSKKAGTVWTEIEKPLYHPELLYAGTPDRIGIDGKGRRVIVDIKTGSPSLSIALQIGGYAVLHKPMTAMVYEGYSVHLQSDGQYRVETYEMEKAIRDWKTIIRFYHLKKELS